MKRKLVRDKIPQIIVDDNKKPISHIADDKEYIRELRLKLIEEVNEFLDDESCEEMADVLEVLHSFCKYKNYSLSDVEKIRIDKREKRGGFDKRIILDSIE